MEKYPLHSRVALLAITSRTGCTSVGDPAMTRRISAVAVCCSRASASRFCASARRFSASARRFSRSRRPEASFFGNLRATGDLASTLAFAGFAPRRIGPSLLLTDPYDRAAMDDRLGED